MEHTLTEITTAKQMRKLLKEQKKDRILAKKQRKANETVNPDVIRSIIESIPQSNSFERRYVFIYDDVSIVFELSKNFHAYKKAFRKLGYRLIRNTDCSGTAFYINF